MALAIKSDFSFLLEVVNWLKRLPFTVEYDREADGSITGEVVEFHALENAPTLEECEAKLISSMREWAEIHAENFSEWAVGRLNEVPYLLKILFSSDEEVKSCLHGKNCENF
ncbi:MAG: hypothetical protein IJU31_05100 [Synergistaceae bacterium]|nr:hypothetical protein [Synergistaceae bacterium]